MQRRRRVAEGVNLSTLLIAVGVILITGLIYSRSIFHLGHGHPASRGSVPWPPLQVSLSTKKRLCRGDVLPETDSKAMEMLRKTELAQKQALVSDKLAQGGLQAQRLGGQAVTADLVKPLDMVAAKHQLREQTKPRPQGKAEVPLVVYVLLETEDGANDANLHYFVREGIREDDGCTHIILVDPKRELKSLPRLPLDGVRYVKRKGGICVWEAVGNLLQSSEVELSKFTSFIILTSRLRGPFLPAYVQSSWTTLLTGKLDKQTKLVAPLITCQDVDWPPSVPQAERRHGFPHIPPHMLVTDRVGLDLMIADGGVFTCHGSKLPNAEAISALRASLLILENRYNLDCLMQRYQGVRWAEKENWGCNAGLEANGGEHYYDGISIHPMEVMFVEVTDMMLRKSLSMAKSAKKYDSWKGAQALLTEDVKSNMYAFDPMLFRAAMISYMERRGPGCFDFAFYARSNPETAAWPIEELWAHFVQSGQFEDRLYRFNCVDLLARSHNCFDTNYYNHANEDLNKLRLEGRALPAREAWGHFLRIGFYESRNYRFMDVCGEDLDSPNNLGEGL